MSSEAIAAWSARVAERLRALFLDAGNTLIFPDWARIAGWCAQAGAPVAASALRQACARAAAAWDDFMGGRAPAPEGGILGAALEAAGLDRSARLHVLHRIGEAEREGTLWREVLPGTADALQTLRSLGLVLGVVSNADGRVEQFLERAGLRPYLDFVIDSARVGVEKPDPRIFRLALERAGVAADEAAHVGDLWSVDVEGARRAGIEAVVMDPVGLYRGCDAPRIRHLAELARALQVARRRMAG